MQEMWQNRTFRKMLQIEIKIIKVVKERKGKDKENRFFRHRWNRKRIINGRNRYRIVSRKYQSNCRTQTFPYSKTTRATHSQSHQSRKSPSHASTATHGKRVRVQNHSKRAQNCSNTRHREPDIHSASKIPLDDKTQKGNQARKHPQIRWRQRATAEH